MSTIPDPDWREQFTTAQQAALEHRPEQWLSVEAGAGAGKTQVVASRFLEIIEKWPTETPRIERIIAITFTRKAAQEMSGRVLSLMQRRIAQLERERDSRGADQQAPIDALLAKLRYARENFHSHRIGTIDSFCRTQLSVHALEAGVEPGFNVIADGEDVIARRDVVQKLIHQWSYQLRQVPSDELSEQEEKITAAYAYMNTQLDAGDVSAILGMAINRRHELDSCLTRWRNFESDELVEEYVAFAVSRGRELLEEGLDQSEVRDSLKRFVEVAPEVLKSDPENPKAICAQLLWKAIENTDASPLERLPGLGRGSQKLWDPFDLKQTDVTQLRNTVLEVFKSYGVDPEIERQSAKLLQALATLLPELKSDYRRLLRGSLDFSDLKHQLLQFVESGGASAVAHRMDYLMVDEFQDTDPVQWRIFTALTAANPRLNLFVVGDGKQSIYRFRGADVSIMSRARDAIRVHNKAAGAAPDSGFVAMRANFRSTGTTLLSGNALFDRVFRLLDDTEQPSRELEDYDAQPGAMELRREGPGEPIGSVEFLPYQVEKELEDSDSDGDAGNSAPSYLAPVEECEARLVAATISDDLIREQGLSPDRIAILTPRHSTIAVLKSALSEKGIPYRVTGGDDLYGQQEAWDLCALLSFLGDPTEPLHLAAFLRSPFAALSDSALVTLALDQRKQRSKSLYEVWSGSDFASIKDKEDVTRLQNAWELSQELGGMAGRVPIAELLEHALETTGTWAWASGSGRDQRNANWHNLIALADKFERQVGPHPQQIGELLWQSMKSGLKEREGVPESENAGVQIMTLHQAKGKEFDAVVMAFLSKGSRNMTERLKFREDGDARPLLSIKARRYRGAKSLIDSSLADRLIQSMEKAREAAELRRLVYVGWTRARFHLRIPLRLKTYKGGSSSKRKGNAIPPDEINSAQDVLLAALGVSDDASMWEGNEAQALEDKLRQAAFDRDEYRPYLESLNIRAVQTLSRHPFPDEAKARKHLRALDALIQKGRVALPLSNAELKLAMPIEVKIPIHAGEELLAKLEFEVGEFQRTRGGLSPDEFGTLVHGLIEEEIKSSVVDRTEYLTGFVADIEKQPLPSSTQSEVFEHVDRALDALQLPADRSRIFPELEIGLLIDGQPANRRLDYVEQIAPGRWRIVDFKTGSIHDEYADQLRVYAMALSKRLAAAGQPPESIATYLLMTASGELQAIHNFSREELHELAATE